MAFWRLFEAEGKIGVDDSEVRRKLQRVEGDFRETTTRIDRMRATAHLNVESREVDKKIDKAERTLMKFERLRATATADVDIDKAERGIAKARGQLAALTKERHVIDVSLSRGSYQTDRFLLALQNRMRSLGGESRTLRDRLRGVGDALHNVRVEAGFVSLSGRALLVTMVGLSPVIASVGGAVAALGASLASAAAGAGALGAAMGVGFIAQLTAVFGVVKPLSEDLRGLVAAQKLYDTAVREAGKNSERAANALDKLRAVQKQSTDAAVETHKAMRDLGEEWNRLVQPSRAQFFDLINDGLRRATELMPRFARVANESFGAAAAGARTIGEALTSRSATNNIITIMREMNGATDELSAGFANLGVVMLRIFRSFSRHFEPVARTFEAWTDGLVEATDNTRSLDRTVDSLMSSTRTWGGVMSDLTRLVLGFFRAAVGEGDRMGESLRKTVDRWADWMNSGEGQRKTRRFLRDAVNLTSQIADILGILAKMWLDLAEAARPFVEALLDAVTFAARLVNKLNELTGGGLFKFLAAWYVLEKAVGWARSIAAALTTSKFLGALGGLGRISRRGVGGALGGGASCLPVCGGGADGILSKVTKGRFLMVAGAVGITAASLTALGLVIANRGGPSDAGRRTQELRELARQRPQGTRETPVVAPQMRRVPTHAGGVLGTTQFKDEAAAARAASNAITKYASAARTARKEAADWGRVMKENRREMAKTEAIDTLRQRVSDLKNRQENLSKGTKEYRQNARALRQTKDELSTAYQRAQERVAQLRIKLNNLDRDSQEYRQTQRQLRRATDDLSDANTTTRERALRAGQAFRSATGNVNKLGEAVSDVSDFTKENVNKLLKELGVKPLKIGLRKFISRSGHDIGITSNREGGIIPSFRGGGRRTAPAMVSSGEMLVEPGGRKSVVPGPRVAADNVLMNLPVGTAVLTDHGRMLHDMGASVASAVRQQMPHFQGGGIVTVPWDPAERINSSILGEVGQFVRRYNADITDAFGPGHKSPGHTVYGTAVDLVPGPGGSWNLLEQGLRMLVASGKQVLYGTNGVGTPYPNHGRGNHAHVEWGGPGAALGPLDLNIPKLDVNAPGFPVIENMLQGIANRERKAANAYIQDKMPAAFGAGHFAGAGATAGGVMSESQFIRLALAALRLTGKFPATIGNARTLMGLAMEESSLNPGAANRTSAGVAAGNPKGILQVVDGTFAAYREPSLPNNPFNALANIAASINYQSSRYGYLVRHAPYGEGGIVGVQSFRDGGEMTLSGEAWRGATPENSWVGQAGPHLLGGRGTEAGGESIRRRGRRRGRRAPVPWTLGFEESTYAQAYRAARLRDIRLPRGDDEEDERNPGRQRARGWKAWTRSYPLARKAKIIGTPHAGTHNLGNWQSDNAVDYGVGMGTPVYAVVDGRIGGTKGGWKGGASRFDGYQVYLNPRKGDNQWWYTHLRSLDVRQGEKVEAGERIGRSGAANGVPHIHLGRKQGDPRKSANWPIPRKGAGGYIQSFQGGGMVIEQGGGGDAGGDTITGGSGGGGGSANPGRINVAINRQEQRIENLGKKYDYWSRKFDMSEEQFVNEGDENTPPSINQAAVAQRSKELERLIHIRREIAMAIKKIMDYLSRLISTWKNLISRYQGMLARTRRRLGDLRGVRGPQARRTREALEDREQKLQRALKNSQFNLDDSQTRLGDATWEWRYAKLDLEELRMEHEPLLGGGKGIELPEWTPPEGGDTGEGAASDLPSFQQQFGEFVAARDELTRNFGVNWSPVGGGAAGAMTAARSGGAAVALLGGGGGGGAGAVMGGGGSGASIPTTSGGGAAGAGGNTTIINQANSFAAPPPDPHTFVHTVLWEAQAVA